MVSYCYAPFFSLFPKQQGKKRKIWVRQGFVKTCILNCNVKYICCGMSRIIVLCIAQLRHFRCHVLPSWRPCWQNGVFIPGDRSGHNVKWRGLCLKWWAQLREVLSVCPLLKSKLLTRSRQLKGFVFIICPAALQFSIVRYYPLHPGKINKFHCTHESINFI